MIGETNLSTIHLDKDGKPLGKAKAAKMLPYRRKMQIISRIRPLPWILE